MSITPNAVSIFLFVIIGLAVASLVVWGLRTPPGKRRGGQAADASKKGSARSGKGPKGSKGGGQAKDAKGAGKAATKGTGREPAAEARKVKAPDVRSPLQRKLSSARTRFAKSLDKRIAREPLVGDRLRQVREQVLAWYDEGGRVVAVRFQASDTRTACKVCVGRHHKEYDLLAPEVVARIVPPSHVADGDRQDCSCTVSPVLVGE